MKILVLHRVPYPRIEYHRGIDHLEHQVTYVGKQSAIDTLPSSLPCTAVVRPGVDDAFVEVNAWLEQNPQHFDRVISMSEYELLDAARLREAHGIAGACVEQVMLSRNKLLMKDAVAAQGLRVPRYLSVAAFLDPAQTCPWRAKTVIKPHSGASSVDVQVYDRVEQAIDSLRRRQLDATLQAEDYEVEEFIEGPIRHFDGLIKEGVVYEITASQYVGTCLAFMERGQPLGSFQIPISAQARNWVEQVLAAVQIRNGSFHLEAIMEGDDPVFLEVGNRVGGADVVATFEMATGVHLPSLELRIHLGDSTLPARNDSSAWRGSFGWFAYAGHLHADPHFHGLVGEKAFCQSDCVIQWHELPHGAPLARHVTYSAHEAPLAGIAGFPSSEQTRDWIVRLFDQVHLRRAASAVA